MVGRLAAIKAELKEFPIVYQDFKSYEEEYARCLGQPPLLQAELDEAKIQEHTKAGSRIWHHSTRYREDFEIEIENAEFPDIKPSDPDFQQRTFVPLNDKMIFLNEANGKAEKMSIRQTTSIQIKRKHPCIDLEVRYAHG